MDVLKVEEIILVLNNSGLLVNDGNSYMATVLPLADSLPGFQKNYRQNDLVRNFLGIGYNLICRTRYEFLALLVRHDFNILTFKVFAAELLSSKRHYTVDSKKTKKRKNNNISVCIFL